MQKASKSVILGLSTLALLTATSTPSQSTTLAGTKCMNLNASKIVNSTKFTCIKSGKKFIWNKGIPVKPVVKPSSTVSPSPSATPTPTPTPTPTIIRQQWENIYLKIWDELSAAQKMPAYPFVYKLSPNVNKAKAQECINAYDKAMKIWQVLIGDTKINPMYWTIINETEYDWWKKTVAEQEGSEAHYPWDPVTNLFGHCKLSPQAFCGYGKTQGSDTPDFKFMQYNVIGSQYSRAPNSNTVNHEATHYYQFAIVQGFPGDTPCWYIEGQASLYGNALQVNPATIRRVSSEERDALIRQALSRGIVPEGIVDVFDVAGLKRPDIGLLS